MPGLFTAPVLCVRSDRDMLESLFLASETRLGSGRCDSRGHLIPVIVSRRTRLGLRCKACSGALYVLVAVLLVYIDRKVESVPCIDRSSSSERLALKKVRLESRCPFSTALDAMRNSE